MENLEIALSLLLTGMLTVFAVLALIVGAGKVMIYLVNTFDSESKFPEYPSNIKSNSISPSTLAAITAAVSIATNGRGQIKEIIKH